VIHVSRNPDGTPDDITVTDPTHVHLEDMGGHWWLRVETAHGAALVVNVHPVVTLPKQRPAWLRVAVWTRAEVARLLRWMRGRVGLSVLVEVEDAPPGRGFTISGLGIGAEEAEVVRKAMERSAQVHDRAQVASPGSVHREQPAPRQGTGDVWQELIDAEPLSALREIYIARRALGLDRYGHILQRDNGRDHALDGQEELLDGIAYFTACGWYDVVASLRTALVCVVARRGET
jgi:hypothetical protein